MPSHGNPTVDGGNLVETKLYPGVLAILLKGI